MLALSESPAEFISNLIASQTRDLKLIKGEPMRVQENEIRTEMFYGPGVEEAVQRYLNSIPLTAQQEPHLAPSPYMQLYRLGLAGR